MSAITILTSALQDDAGAGGAVDVSAFSTLRLTWSTVVDIGRLGHGYLRIFIETAATATGPWRVVYEKQLNSSWDTRPRAVLSGFDAFVRARWEGSLPRINNEQPPSLFLPGGAPVYTGPVAKFFTIGLAGEAT